MKTPNSLELNGAKALTKKLAPTQEAPSQSIDLLMQQSLSTGGVAIGTIIAMSLLLREIRLLIQACKG